MGRGSLYSYSWFMLIDEEKLIGENLEFEEERNILFEDFKEHVKEVFQLQQTDVWPSQREAYYLGENEFLFVGIDHSGGFPCLFIQLRYEEDEKEEFEEDYETSYEEHVEQINEFVTQGFKNLLNTYSVGAFRKPLNSWVSETIVEYP